MRPYLTLRDAAEYLSVNERSIRSAVSRGDLKSYRFGTKHLFRVEDLDALVNKKEK
jgi:excisionase family DNA binding protein